MGGDTWVKVPFYGRSYLDKGSIFWDFMGGDTWVKVPFYGRSYLDKGSTLWEVIRTWIKVPLERVFFVNINPPL